jgi:hypothetical protein
MKPAARRKCADAIPMIRKNEYLDSLSDGINTLMRTDPERNAAVRTRSH